MAYGSSRRADGSLREELPSAIRHQLLLDGRINMRITTIAAGAVMLTQSTAAQSLASRVAAAPDGWVQMRFAARPGVCGNGRGLLSTGGNTLIGNVDEIPRGNWRAACRPGPLRVLLTVRDREVVALRTHVGGEAEAAQSPLTDLGTVSVRDATEYLLGFAAQHDGKVAEKAILPAALADSVVIWPALLRMARDESVAKGVRRDAYFWIGRAAAAASTGTTEAELDDDPSGHGGGESAVRVQAVFALSQLPRNQGVPELLEVARTNRDPHVRRSAIFWLSQSGDPRALDLFEEILRARR
jgi:hypothetical protein